jgi:uncharacterized protein DUF6916
MSAPLTEAEFSKHVNTKFRVAVEPPVELELEQVKGYLSQPHEETGMERFSIFFAGPNDRCLEQRMYSLEHEQMGTFDLFLVPVSRDARGFHYEAVFNYFREK